MPDKYMTAELFFSKEEWKIMVDEVNSHQEMPLGMKTYIAKSVRATQKTREMSLIYYMVSQKNATNFESQVTSHYVEFNPSPPMWKHFDVSICHRHSEKLYLKVTLDGKS